MRSNRRAGSFTVKVSTISAHTSERGKHLQRFADRLIAHLDPNSNLGCKYHADTNQLICFKK